jgi:hypothetical protein
MRLWQHGGGAGGARPTRQDSAIAPASREAGFHVTYVVAVPSPAGDARVPVCSATLPPGARPTRQDSAIAPASREAGFHVTYVVAVPSPAGDARVPVCSATLPPRAEFQKRPALLLGGVSYDDWFSGGVRSSAFDALDSWGLLSPLRAEPLTTEAALKLFADVERAACFDSLLSFVPAYRQAAAAAAVRTRRRRAAIFLQRAWRSKRTLMWGGAGGGVPPPRAHRPASTR